MSNVLYDTAPFDGSTSPSNAVTPGVNRRHSWGQFREAGMLWTTNRVLHIFGWAIVVATNESDEVVEVYPVRTEWRGFSAEANERGHLRVAAWMAAAGDALQEETNR